MAIDKIYKKYGYIEDNSANLKKIKEILENFSIEEIEINKNRLDFFSWDNFYFDLEDLLKSLSQHLSPQAKGQIDYIDYEEWKMLRIEIKNGQMKQYPIYIDKALENCILEH
ncbi:MAG: hypothetical protein PWR24_331 [Desulfonauticus sp.]|jgi:hypothetical protein|nr:hypothetical protein [Desulfonauticus sp.]